jgi:hypothetical protein
MPDPDVSQSTMNDLVKSGSYSTGANIKVTLRELNAAAASGVQRNASRLSS